MRVIRALRKGEDVRDPMDILADAARRKAVRRATAWSPGYGATPTGTRVHETSRLAAPARDLPRARGHFCGGPGRAASFGGDARVLAFRSLRAGACPTL